MKKISFGRHFCQRSLAFNKIIIAMGLSFFLMPTTSLSALNVNEPSLTTKVQANNAEQNKITVKGIVKDSKGEPIIGAYVLEKGTTNGTSTDFDGNFSLSVPQDAILEVTYIGFTPANVPVGGRANITIDLTEDNILLDQVVVTAMGIERKASSLTYSVQQVGGDDLTRVKDANMVNSLAGKIAGVNITKSSSGLGGSAKVSIRGTRSAYENGNNQPLYVIDGVPMMSGAKENVETIMGGLGGNHDQGDGVSNINPEDIESISVLKGASAAALYGAQASNGVIMITTKKGKEGITNVTFSSNYTFDQAWKTPKFQNSYNANWEKVGNMTIYDNVDDYFSTGNTWINSLTFSSGNQMAQTYFSYTNTNGRGTVDNNKLNRHNLTIRETANFFNNRLTLDANVNLMYQNSKNRPVTGGLYLNPLVGLYTFPRGMDMGQYKSGEIFNEERNMPQQTWWTNPNSDGMTGNPYWMKNRVTSEDSRYRTMASLTAKVKATDWLTIQARGNVDYTSDKNEQKIWASTSTTLTGGNWEGGTDNGRYVYGMGQDFMAYGDVMAMFNKTWNDWSLNAVLGASATYNKSNSLSIDSRLAGLHNPNVFTITNINYTAGTGMNVTNKARSTSESIFATAQIGWKEALYLDLSARNDWASTLYGTTSDKKGFFYPSVGLSWLINNSLNMPEWISMAKVRGSYAKVGNSLPLYMANLQPSISIGGGINQVVNYNDGTLKPEMTTSYEAGAELKLLGYRLDVDFTWYKTETRNQFLLVPMLPGSAYAYKMINAGKINNQGIELTVGGVPVQTPEFRWRTQVNFSTNSNKVVKLADGFTQFQYGGAGLNMSYRMFVKEGGSLGDLYGRTYERDDNGSILFGNDGLPLVADGYNYVGNSNPKYNLGWSNSFSYKGFNLNLLIDGVIGGKVMSITQAMLDEAGVSANVGKALDRGYVELEGKKINDVKAFYAKVGGRQGISENYMYKRTNFRLRELSLGYSFPQRMMERTNFFKDITVSFVARNLFFLYKDAPFDPDALMSVGNANQGVDVFCLPTTQSFGFNVKFQF